MNKTAATDLTRSQNRYTGLKGLPHRLIASNIREVGSSLVSHIMVQFPADFPHAE